MHTAPVRPIRCSAAPSPAWTAIRYSLVGAVGHDFYEGERDGPRGFPRFTDPLAPPGRRVRAATCGWPPSGAWSGSARTASTSCCSTTRTGPGTRASRSGRGWRPCAKPGWLTRSASPRARPTASPSTWSAASSASATTIDWAMIILNPFEPWPGELCLDAAARHGVRVITRVVDYGGIFWDDVTPRTELPQGDHRSFRPEGWIAEGRAKLDRLRPIAERAGLTPMQLACQWNLAHDAVECVVPTLIQEMGEDARPIEEKRAELAALPAERRLTDDDLGEIRTIGDNAGCMGLKGATPDHTGDERPDRWPVSDRARPRSGALGHRPRARLAISGGRARPLTSYTAPPRQGWRLDGHSSDSDQESPSRYRLDRVHPGRRPADRVRGAAVLDLHRLARSTGRPAPSPDQSPPSSAPGSWSPTTACC